MPTQLEEVIARADVLDVQHVFPDARQHLLHGCARCGGIGLRVGTVLFRVGQGFAVYLPVVRQREGVKRHKSRGQHVLGQSLPQELAQVSVERGGGPLVRHDVGHQALVAGYVLAHNHQRVADCGVRGQHGLYLARLDAEAANLHLMIGASEELYLAAGHEAR